MADPEVPKLLVDQTFSWAVEKVRRRLLGGPNVLLRSELIKLPRPASELVALFGTLFYSLGSESPEEEGHRSPTPSERLDAVALDLNQLATELTEIESLPQTKRAFASKIAEERRRLVSVLSRLEHLALPGLRRSGRHRKTKTDAAADHG